ncbi:MAG: hypothetical protein HY074_02035 [Deltaproteobacteria bacterium]|nr:hypothetical protein [Deltaproteobacteria bacterium]
MRKLPKSFQRLAIGGIAVFGAAQLAQQGMFRANRGVVQAGRDAVGLEHLPRLVLKKIGKRAVKYPGRATRETRGMLAAGNADAASFDAGHRDAGIIDERVKQADGIASAAHARNELIGQLARLFQNLPARLDADDRLKVAHDERIRVRAECRAQAIICIAHIADPIAHGFAHGIFQGLRARGHGYHGSPQVFHALDIGRLPGNIDLAHVNHAFEPQQCRNSGGGYAVLSCAGFGDNSRFAHASGQ